MTFGFTAKEIPQFIEVDYIEVAKVHRISKFRSGIGHDYSSADYNESYRSMKHHYEPKDSVDWTKVKVFSPVDGTVTSMYGEPSDAQVQIKVKDYPAFTVIIFHVELNEPLASGDEVVAGQQLGTITSAKYHQSCDITVSVQTPQGGELISYFDSMPDKVFQAYQDRGIASRDTFIISKEERDANPLTCIGEEFANKLEEWNNPENWVVLD